MINRRKISATVATIILLCGLQACVYDYHPLKEHWRAAALA
jgi:hypothetical protein